MANDLNKVILIGRLTRDPEYKTINGTSLVNFSIANNRTYVTGGEKREETHYFDCEAWGKLADIIRQYTGKGKQILVEGRLKQDTWETDGKKMSKIRLVTENMQLLGSSQGGQGGGEGSQGGSGGYGQDSPSSRSDSYGSSGDTGYPSRPSTQFDDYEASSDEEPF